MGRTHEVVASFAAKVDATPGAEMGAEATITDGPPGEMAEAAAQWARHAAFTASRSAQAAQYAAAQSATATKSAENAAAQVKFLMEHPDMNPAGAAMSSIDFVTGAASLLSVSLGRQMSGSAASNRQICGFL